MPLNCIGSRICGLVLLLRYQNLVLRGFRWVSMHGGVLFGLYLWNYFRMWLSVGLSPIFRWVKHILEVLAVRLATISSGAALAHGRVVALLHLNSARNPMRVARQWRHRIWNNRMLMMMYKIHLSLPHGGNHIKSLSFLPLIDASQILGHLCLCIVNWFFGWLIIGVVQEQQTSIGGCWLSSSLPDIQGRLSSLSGWQSWSYSIVCCLTKNSSGSSMMIFRWGSDRITLWLLESTHNGWITYLKLVAAARFFPRLLIVSRIYTQLRI